MTRFSGQKETEVLRCISAMFWLRVSQVFVCVYGCVCVYTDVFVSVCLLCHRAMEPHSKNLMGSNSSSRLFVWACARVCVCADMCGVCARVCMCVHMFVCACMCGACACISECVCVECVCACRCDRMSVCVCLRECKCVCV